MSELINGKVYSDYRDNIIIDKNNVILAMKASRDRYDGTREQLKSYAGLSMLGSIKSEDALSWNYFRSMELNSDFSSLEDLLKIKIENPQILYWTFSTKEENSDLQYHCGRILRKYDGSIDSKQMTEPDIIIKTKDYMIFIECKLGEKKSSSNHLWETNNSAGPKVREKIYFSNDLFIGKEGYYDDAYQLYRMAFFAEKLAMQFDIKPFLVSLANKTWWNDERPEKPKIIWDSFCKQVNQKKIQLKSLFWQDIKTSGTFLDYLSKLKYLK